jgi:hypothetical protein
MIGVIADPSEHDVVREFFELFKTPWEFFRESRKYDVLLCAGGHPFNTSAKLVVVYAGKRIELDDARHTAIGNQRNTPCILDYEKKAFPVYGGSTSFAGKENALLRDVTTNECVAFFDSSADQLWARIGFDLFKEIRTLLTEGQPVVNAASPTLDLHIAFLRNLITAAGVELVEIPPVPEGYKFIACLTHDVDHPSIRAHKWDHTIFGFLYRAIFGSLLKLISGQFSLRDLRENWAAAFKLPFIYAGLAKDFWRDFADRYLVFEQGLPSTFFVIPFKNRPGKTANGSAPSFRGAAYGAQDIADLIQKLVSAGQEVSLHGIDAWIDSGDGRRELEEIRGLTGTADSGVRMHWLYYDQNSPATLEKAGAAYDSTIGYNQTVGYRAGTTQVYKPLSTNRLLELPLHVMDTALFYPGYLNLSRQQAGALCGKLMDNAAQFGGAFTVNWHDRSLAPERLWGGSYGDLIQGLKDRGAWFATAGQAVAWFRKRRSAEFVTDPADSLAVSVKVAPSRSNSLPGLRLRIHKPWQRGDLGAQRPDRYSDMAVEEMGSAGVASEVSR